MRNRSHLSGQEWRWTSRVAHLSLFQRFDGEAVGSDVHYSSQLEPVRWVWRPHRLPILHRAALRALENMTWQNRAVRHTMFSLLDVKVHSVVRELNFTAYSFCLFLLNSSKLQMNFKMLDLLVLHMKSLKRPSDRGRHRLHRLTCPKALWRFFCGSQQTN